MTFQLLESRPVVDKTIDILVSEVANMVAQGVVPSMKVILVGDLAASVIYTRNKKIFCEQVGAKCEIVNLPAEIRGDEFLQEVGKITNDPTVHGCFVQLPLPKQLKHIDVGSLIPPEKDVDGFNSQNISLLFKGDIGHEALLPCTPKGIISLCRYYGISLEGKNIVILGRSSIVGKPLALLFTSHNATVTLCHSKTKNLKEFTKKADIIVVAIGSPKYLTADFLGTEKSQIIIDVGINHDENGKLCGDCDFEALKDKVKAITPVPGGVGPLTILSLVQNLLQATKKSLYK